MAKRFTDTDLWDKEWFMKLPMKGKLLIRFLFDKCDAAGVWAPNWVLASTYIGDEVCEDDLSIFNGRIEKLHDGKFFILDFIGFQYGQLSEHCKPHLKIISLLKKYKLLDRVSIHYTKGIQTLEEKEEEEEEDKDKEKEKTKKGSGEKTKNRSTMVRPSENHGVTKQDYEKIIDEINSGLSFEGSWIKIRDFINSNKPLFIEPYVDLWNLFASKRELTKVDGITDSRKAKFKTRIREPNFDFIKILEAIKTNDFYLGNLSNSDWKVDFDFIIHSEQNYIKIIERRKK